LKKDEDDLSQKILKMFKKVGMDHFFGDYFDARFYVADLIAKKHVQMILDIGCGAGVLLNCANASIKIGIDTSFDSLKMAKILNSKMELIQADATNLPFRDDIFSDIIGMHLVPVVKTFQGEDWKKSIDEMKRISSKKCKIILTGANRMSIHFKKTHSLESRRDYLTYNEQSEYFQDQFQVESEGYCPYSKKIMYPLKIIHRIPDSIIENLKINWLLYRILRSSKFLKNGRSYVMTCEKTSK